MAENMKIHPAHPRPFQRLFKEILVIPGFDQTGRIRQKIKIFPDPGNLLRISGNTISGMGITRFEASVLGKSVITTVRGRPLSRRGRDPLGCMRNTQSAGFQIDIRPFQGADLAKPHPCIETQKKPCAPGNVLVLPEISLELSHLVYIQYFFLSRFRPGSTVFPTYTYIYLQMIFILAVSYDRPSGSCRYPAPSWHT